MCVPACLNACPLPALCLPARPPACLPADWNDIAGQQTAKDLIQEVVVWPIKNPQLFTVGGWPRKAVCVGACGARQLGRCKRR